MTQPLNKREPGPYQRPGCRIRRIETEAGLCTSPPPPPGGNEDVGYEDWQL